VYLDYFHLEAVWDLKVWVICRRPPSPLLQKSEWNCPKKLLRKQTLALASVNEDLNQSRANVVDMLVVADEIENCGEIFNWAFYCSMAFLLALAALCLCFMIEAVFELSRVTKCLQLLVLVRPCLCSAGDSTIKGWTTTMKASKNQPDDDTLGCPSQRV
jgi:hypothetical protein